MNILMCILAGIATLISAFGFIYFMGVFWQKKRNDAWPSAAMAVIFFTLWVISGGALIDCIRQF